MLYHDLAKKLFDGVQVFFSLSKMLLEWQI